MLPHRNLAVLRTTTLFCVLAAAFNLGRYSALFTGNRWAWTAVVLSFLVLAIGCYSMLRNLWRKDGRT